MRGIRPPDWPGPGPDASGAANAEATADAEGWPDCSYKGGRPGFVRVVSDDTLAFPSYDGNGMFKSLGNVLRNPKVGMLFVDFAKPRRLRVNGIASIDCSDPLLGEFAGKQLVVRDRAGRGRRTARYPVRPRPIDGYCFAPGMLETFAAPPVYMLASSATV